MSDAAAPFGGGGRADAVPLVGGRSAGAMIRDARQAQGLHIAALAAAIKVSQHKLELLEADRVDQLPDATFARALAQTVCRFLKIDPQPVLAQLPQLGGYRLEHLGDGINMPFRDRPGRRETGDWSVLASPAVWGPALLVLAALALYVAPAGWLGRWPDWASRWASRTTAAEPISPAAEAPTAAGDTSTLATADPTAGGGAGQPIGGAGQPTEPAPPVAGDAAAGTLTAAAADPAASGAAATAGSGAEAAAASALPTLQLRANAESWVEVVDARSQVLLSRMLRPGETVSLEGSMPLKLKVGNAAGTEAVFRGQALNLLATTRDNVARLELK